MGTPVAGIEMSKKQSRRRPYYWVWKEESEVWVPVTPVKGCEFHDTLGGAVKKLTFGRKQLCPQKRPA
jgi:hypothetical protein